jgi:hypothetical protein
VTANSAATGGGIRNNNGTLEITNTQAAWKIAPRFVLFAGDASYDARNYLGLGDFDFVPTRLVDTAYMETASDDWFADFNDDGLPELATGRLPARTEEELSQSVAKILRADSSSTARAVTLVADRNDGFDFEEASRNVGSLVPKAYEVGEIFRSRTDDETARRMVIERLNRGQRLVNYVGHGSVNQWRGGLLSAAEARNLTNKSLPVFVMMNCLNGYFHDAVQDSLAEALLKARGGAVALWASTGLTSPSEQARMNEELYRLLFGKKASALKLGEVTRKAKAAVGDADVRRSWVLLGDPTMPWK